MTYLVAWKSIDSVFVSADSAHHKHVSYGQPEKPITSFLEKNVLSDDYIVDDSLLKVRLIHRHVICGFAGLTQTGIDVIKEISSKLKGESIIDVSIMKSMLQQIINFLPDHDKNNVALVFGFVNLDKGSTHLISYNFGWGGLVQEHEDLIQIGNLSNDTPLSNGLNTFLADLLRKKVTDNQLLVFVNSFVQGYFINNYSLESDYSGGHFWGAIVNKSGCNYQADTLYVMYSDEDDVDIVQAGSRQDSVFVFNARKGGYIQFGTFITEDQQGSVINEWRKFYLQSYFKYLVFLSKKKRDVFVVERSSSNSDSIHFKYIVSGNRIIYKFEDALKERLFKETSGDEFEFLLEKTDMSKPVNNTIGFSFFGAWKSNQSIFPIFSQGFIDRFIGNGFVCQLTSNGISISSNTDKVTTIIITQTNFEVINATLTGLLKCIDGIYSEAKRIGQPIESTFKAYSLKAISEVINLPITATEWIKMKYIKDFSVKPNASIYCRGLMINLMYTNGSEYSLEIHTRFNSGVNNTLYLEVAKLFEETELTLEGRSHAIIEEFELLRDFIPNSILPILYLD